MIDSEETPPPLLPEEGEAEVFQIKEVKYSLPRLLKELVLERKLSHFAKEILDQVEISKLFAQARKARARRR